MDGKEQFSNEKNRLLALLLKDGIYYGTPERPVLSGDGKPARWMLDSLGVSLTTEGLRLAGRCLLKLLETFNGHTLATYGTIGIPLMASCILQSDGRYEGLLVRKEIKTYGSRKSIEGRIHKDEPVIIVDDSISSGRTMLECRRRLEEEGFCVEGGVCLVRFGWYNGFGKMQELGYHMEALFDIWEDVMVHMENEPRPVLNPTKLYPDFTWNNRHAPEGMHPAVLARLVLNEYLDSGTLLRPPLSLDREVDGAGGVWVSVRPRSDIYQRHAREGMWHFPGESFGPIGEDLVRAALKTVLKLEKGDAGKKQLQESAVAVTFFSAMEECTVGELDNDRYGIVVLSRERPGVMGGALPRMPGISNSWMQFQHARIKNAGLVRFEPYRILRHDVVKVVEPNEVWQPTGVPKHDTWEWYADLQAAGKIAHRALDLVTSTLAHTPPSTDPLPDNLMFTDLDSIFVTVYEEGKLKGCMGSTIAHLDEDLQTICHQVIADSRFGESPIANCTAVTVSFLRDPLDIGVLPPDEIMVRIRFGEQALMVSQGKRSGLLLPFTAALLNLTPDAYALEVIDKAGITRPPYHWRRYECQTWMVVPGQEPRMMKGMFPIAPPSDHPEENLEYDARLLSDYLLRLQKEDGALYFHYSPFTDTLTEKVDLPRLAHACWALMVLGEKTNRSEVRESSAKLLSYLLNLVESDPHGQVWLKQEDNSPSVSESSFLLLAISHSPDVEIYRTIGSQIADTLWSRINRHGKVEVFLDPAMDNDGFQDYFPGQMLLALGKACRVGISTVDAVKLQRAFEFYRRRFRYKRDFGQVSWMMQAFSEWFLVTHEPEFAAFVFEIGEWILEFQDQKGGGFWNDHQPDTPGFTTALYLEGLGDAATLATVLGERRRADRYREACLKGVGFLDRLIIQERDAPILPNSEWALGGVRASLYQSDIRTDFVQHTLAAVLKLLAN
ncbi:MAG: AMMECR1 domain-containing protein [Candidatus Omnitrophota bacterium]